MLSAAFALLFLIQTSAVTGNVSGTGGAPLRNATLVLSSAQSGARLMTTTDAAGAFEFSGLPAGEYSLEVCSAVESGYKWQGYETRKVLIRVPAGGTVRQDFRLRMVVAI